MTTLVIKAARPLQRRRQFQGLEVSIENQCGSYRCWKDHFAGTEGRTKMHYDYGYIRGTKGTDGDHVDVYVGPNKNATHAYIVTQMKPPHFLEVDEQKVMLGFDSASDAEAAYRLHYDKPGFFGMMQAMPMGEFRAKVLNKQNHGQLVKSALVKGADGSLLCPHCSVAVFIPRGDVMKARTSIVVLHSASGLMEINCNVCKGAVTFMHGQSTPPAIQIERDPVVKAARPVLTLGAAKKT
jgi:hypothetical protein